MEKVNVRISGIEINRFKNVIKGTLSFENPRKDYKASILGLYGQNGSGKTTLIDAIELLKCILSGNSIDQKFADYINVDSKEAEIIYSFSLENGKEKMDVHYRILIGTQSDDGSGKKVRILNESLRCPILSDKRVQQGKLIETDASDLFVPVPKRQLLVGKDKDDMLSMLVAKKLTEAQSRSFIFSEELIGHIRDRVNSDLLEESQKEEILYYFRILFSLSNYGKRELYVINTRNSGIIALNVQPLMFKYEDGKRGAFGGMVFDLNGPCIIHENQMEIAEKVIASMNLVLKQMIPGLTIGIRELGTELMENGEVGHRIQFVSERDQREIPLNYESEGIKKIISILQLLIVVFNQPSVTLAVDELDSGIFEYLLGELLSIIAEKGKGQLIFTSHDLRPLETIDRGFIAFTTTNPENRYVRLSGIKESNNLRDCFYRNIMLGGSEEELYDHTNNSEIALAFMEAGEHSGS